MQFLIDLLPVIAFFVAYKVAGIYVATGVLIVGVLLQTAVELDPPPQGERRCCSPRPSWCWCSAGSRSLIHDPTFIKWKPSIVNWLFAAAFLAQPVHAAARRSSSACSARTSRSTTAAGGA
ncbi:MAG: septation protein IspZ [Chromatiales bacterium]|nr:septation protein IspZ [Chromatiales bacterium]